MTAGKAKALTIQTFYSRVMPLLSNILFGFVMRLCLLVLWLQSPSAAILEPKKIKSVTVSIVPSSICHEVMGLDE